MTPLRVDLASLPRPRPRRRGSARRDSAPGWRLSRDWHPLRGWRRPAAWLWRRLAAAPRPMQIALGGAAFLVFLAAGNILYQVARKPTELLSPLGSAFAKTPGETWRQYAALFREYSTAAVPPELLAALAQVEGGGNPLASTYWRWRLTWNPFAIYQPASSAVGTYQMTDAAFAEARRYCIQNHIVVEEGCWLNGLYSRMLPSHAVELTAVFLDRHVAAILAGRPKAKPTPQQKQSLAAIVHLCGPGPAKGFARRGFYLIPGERCGDHIAADYLAKVNAMKREFLRLAAVE